MKILICTCLCIGMVAPVLGQETQQDEGAIYRDLMKAQYAARQKSLPARPEESQKIYDVYLQSIGRPAPAQTDDAANAPSSTSH